jgi:GGDEF domain-containing protein
MVIQYFDQYEKQIDKIYSNQEFIHTYIDQIIGNHILSAAENLKLLSEANELSSSGYDENIQPMLINNRVFDALMILDAEGTEQYRFVSERTEGYDYANVIMTERVKALEGNQILISSIPQDVVKTDQPLISMMKSSSNKNRLGEYIFAVVRTDDIIKEIESLYHDHLYSVFDIEEADYSYSESAQIKFTTINGESFKNLQIDWDHTEKTDAILQEFSKAGLYTVSPISLERQNLNTLQIDESDLNVLLVSFVPYETFLMVSQEVFTNQLRFGMIIFSILLILSILVSGKMNESNYNREMVDNYTTYDFQTGCYNKRAGIDFLSKVFELSKRKLCPLTLVSLNIADMSTDYRSDDETDSCNLIEKISNRIRQSDFIIMIDRHDFLIALYDCTQEDAGKMINHIFDSIDSSSAQIKMNWGIADNVNNKTNQLDELIRKANKRMLRNKKTSRIDQMINQLNK